MRQQLELFLLGAILIIVGTGLYTQFPGLAYIPVFCMFAMLVTNKIFLKNPLHYIEPNMVCGFIILNSFFLLQLMFRRIDYIDYAFQFFAISSMFVTYISTKIIIYDNEKILFKKITYINILMLISLIFILCGQIAQITGYIESRNFEEAEEEFLVAISRPGGFLNPNVTAAIAITILFVIDKMRAFNGKLYYLIVMILSMTIILLTQSRSSIIALIIFLALIVLRSSIRALINYTVISSVILYSIFLIDYENILELVANNIKRFSGDASSDERINLIYLGLQAFIDSPIFGNGNWYLVGLYGQSSHNQITEILINYGIFGLFIFILIIYFLYAPISLALIIFCMLPMFIFSHNFFDSASYQINLGLALVLDRLFLNKKDFQSKIEK